MLIKVNTSKDRKAFAKAGVSFSRNYPNGIIRLMNAELNQIDKTKNFFYKNGGVTELFLVKINDEIIGRIAAMINPAFMNDENKTGFVGLFDCINDYKVAEELLSTAVSWLKTNGCKEIWGPFDFSMWHNYRFMTEGFETYPYPGEPRNPKYYPGFFEKFGFAVLNTWETQCYSKNDMELFIAKNKQQSEMYDALGYTLETLNNKNKNNLMHLTYSVISEAYKVFPAFSEISEDDFMQHYQRMPDIIDRNCSFFLRNPDGKFAGLILVMKDLFPAVQAMNGKTNILAKLNFLLNKNRSKMAVFTQGASLPFFIREAAVLGKKNAGTPLTLAGAVTCKCFKKIIESNRYEHVVLSLMRHGGPVNNHGVGIFSSKRNYALYNFKKPNILNNNQFIVNQRITC